MDREEAERGGGGNLRQLEDAAEEQAVGGSALRRTNGDCGVVGRRVGLHPRTVPLPRLKAAA